MLRVKRSPNAERFQKFRFMTHHQANSSFPSIRTFAKALDRSPSTVHTWIKHPDWKLSRKPPWTLDDAAAALKWSLVFLQEQRGAWDRPRKPLNVSMPGPFGISAADVYSGKDFLSSLRPWFGEMWEKLTTADIEDLAKCLNYIVCATLAEHAIARDGSFKGEASREYYAKLMDLHLSTDRNGVVLASRFNSMTCVWASGVLKDRPGYPELSKRHGLSEFEDEPTATAGTGGMWSTT
jgi:hypothetical protein